MGVSEGGLVAHPVRLGAPGEGDDDLEGLAQRDHLHGRGGGCCGAIVPARG